MTQQHRRFVTAAMAVLALLPLSAPASATTVKVVTFVGGISLSGCSGLGDVVFTGVPQPSATVKAGPKGEPQLNIAPGGTHCNFHMATATCVKTSAGKKIGLDVCTIVYIGTIWGYCGYSTGMGIATVNSPTKGSFTFPFKFTNVRGTWAFSGGNARTHFYAEVRSVPTTGSCSTSTATGFTQAGDGVFKDITP